MKRLDRLFCTSNLTRVFAAETPQRAFERHAKPSFPNALCGVCLRAFRGVWFKHCFECLSTLTCLLERTSIAGKNRDENRVIF